MLGEPWYSGSCVDVGGARGFCGADVGTKPVVASCEQERAFPKAGCVVEGKATVSGALELSAWGEESGLRAVLMLEVCAITHIPGFLRVRVDLLGQEVVFDVGRKVAKSMFLAEGGSVADVEEVPYK
jgi:hypothetical protein